MNIPKLNVLLIFTFYNKYLVLYYCSFTISWLKETVRWIMPLHRCRDATSNMNMVLKDMRGTFLTNRVVQWIASIALIWKFIDIDYEAGIVFESPLGIIFFSFFRFVIHVVSQTPMYICIFKLKYAFTHILFYCTKDGCLIANCCICVESMQRRDCSTYTHIRTHVHTNTRTHT